MGFGLCTNPYHAFLSLTRYIQFLTFNLFKSFNTTSLHPFLDLFGSYSYEIPFFLVLIKQSAYWCNSLVYCDVNIWGFHDDIYEEYSVTSCSLWFYLIVSNYLEMFIISGLKISHVWPPFMMLQTTRLCLYSQFVSWTQFLISCSIVFFFFVFLEVSYISHSHINIPKYSTFEFLFFFSMLSLSFLYGVWFIRRNIMGQIIIVLQCVFYCQQY